MELAISQYLAEAPVFVRTLSGTITYWTTGAEHLYGYTWDEAVGQTSHSLLSTVFPQPLKEIEVCLLREGRWQGLLNHTRKDGLTLWTESQWRLKGDDGDQNNLFVVESNIDVTAREVLSRKLSHRLKNTLATVSGLAHLGLRPFCDPEKFNSFSARLEALGLAQDMLLSHHWDHGELREVISRAGASFGVLDRLETSGPEVFLLAGSVFAYTLFIHELITNSVKYGALSVAQGKVQIAWELLGDEHQKIHLVWREQGGPPVTAPTKKGFGTGLMVKMLKLELGNAPMRMQFNPDGLVCEIDGPAQKHPAL